MDDIERDELLIEIQNDPEGILTDETKLRLVVVDPELASLLVESKDEPQLLVEIDGEQIKLKRSVNPTPPPVSNYHIDTIPLRNNENQLL
jgi:hypothetical protein